MRKYLTILLCTSLICTGCAGTPIAARPGDAQRNQALRRADEEDDEDTWISLAVGAVIFVVAIPFVAMAQHFEKANTDLPAVAVRKMADPANADQRRQGMVELVTHYDFAKRPPYTDRYKQLAQNDPDFTVRAMAIRALNICRDKSATPIFIAGLTDPAELIRLESAKALANIPDPAAIPALLKIVEGRRDQTMDEVPHEETKDVRIAAADALRNYHDLDVARVLINTLGAPDFGLAWQSHRSLIVITGRDLHYDQAAWLQFLSGSNKPFG